MSREYLTAGRAIDAVDRGVTFKAYCAKNRMGKVDFALAAETLKYKSVLINVLNAGGVSAQSLDVGSQGLVEVMLYELLIGNGKIRGGGAVKRQLLAHIEELRAALQAQLSAAGATTVAELLPAHVRLAQLLPQYLRINPLQLHARGLSKLHIEEEIRQQCPGAQPDADIPHLFVLPLRSPSFGQHQRVQDGCLIIQDKASCFPSQLLADAWIGGDVIDACAAPGNKTSHVAACLQEKVGIGGPSPGTIYAFDKNPRRAELLAQRMKVAGATKVQVQNADFLELDVHDPRYANVGAVLLDPSCSGSGVARDLNRHNDEGDTADRLLKLRTFQLQALLKAFSFPAVQLVLYSTCSVHREENEDVVAEALASVAATGWMLDAPARLSSWKRRGLAHPALTAQQSHQLIRCAPEDGLNGFFVAQFRRRISGHEDVHSSKRSATDPELARHSERVNEPQRKRSRRLGDWRPLHASHRLGF